MAQETDELGRITETPTKRFWWLFLGITVYVAILFGVAYKTGYAAYDSEQKKFVKSNSLFYDDGGVYVSEAIVLDHWSTFSREEWFRQIRNHISQEGLQALWGPYAPKVQFIFTRFSHEGWLWILLFFENFTKDYQEAFRVTFLSFPVFVIGKYILLFFLFRRERDRGFFPLATSFLLVDLAQTYEHNFYWFGPSAFSYLFFMTGFALRTFSSLQRARRLFLSYLLMGLGVYMWMIMLPVFLIVLFVDLLTRAQGVFQKIAMFNSRHFGKIVVTFLASTVVIGLINLIIDASKGSLGDLQHGNAALTLFSARVSYISFINVLLLYLFFSLTKDFREKRNHILSLKLIVSIFLGAVVLYIMISPWLIELQKANVNRLNNPLFGILTISAAYAYWYGKRGAWNGRSHPLLIGGAIAGVVIGFTNYANVWKIQQNIPFTEDAYPVLITEAPNIPYYLAKNPQQVYGYFMGSRYLDGPLVLQFATEDYSEANVVKMLTGLEVSQ